MVGPGRADLSDAFEEFLRGGSGLLHLTRLIIMTCEIESGRDRFSRMLRFSRFKQDFFRFRLLSGSMESLNERDAESISKWQRVVIDGRKGVSQDLNCAREVVLFFVEADISANDTVVRRKLLKAVVPNLFGFRNLVALLGEDGQRRAVPSASRIVALPPPRSAHRWHRVLRRLRRFGRAESERAP